MDAFAKSIHDPPNAFFLLLSKFHRLRLNSIKFEESKHYLIINGSRSGL